MASIGFWLILSRDTARSSHRVKSGLTSSHATEWEILHLSLVELLAEVHAKTGRLKKHVANAIYFLLVLSRSCGVGHDDRYLLKEWMMSRT